MQPPPDNLIFDLDGTLIDTVPDIAYCIDWMAVRLGLRPPGREKVSLWVGNGLTQLVKRALTGSMTTEPPAAQLATALKLYKEAYAKHYCVDSRVYPGVLETLRQLQALGRRLAVVTNKNSAFTGPILDYYGLAGFFSVVLSGDSLPQHKPDPAPLLQANRRLGGGHCWVVGDSVNDVAAARAAHLPVVCVTYGYNHGRDIREAQPDAVIEHFADLLPLVAARTPDPP